MVVLCSCVAVLMWKDRIQTHRDLATMERPGGKQGSATDMTAEGGGEGRLLFPILCPRGRNSLTRR